MLLKVKNLTKSFSSRGKILQAVNGVSFEIERGETLGLVGESGSGKSTLGRTILRLEEPTSGKVFFDGQDVTTLRQKELKRLRRKMQIIFQDPYASLDPRMTVKEILREPLDLHGLYKAQRLEELMEKVGLDPELIHRFPHEFSGGQRQRIGIARALAVEPTFIVCDEPVSALDVTIQAQIIHLLTQLQKDLGLTYLFIAHQLAVVRYISHRVAVMYLGDFVELAPTQELYDHPLHPYTQALLSAIPIPDPKVERKRTRIVLKEEIPNPWEPPSGCPFHTRCPFAMPVCRTVKPEWKEVRPGHFTSCHLY